MSGTSEISPEAYFDALAVLAEAPSSTLPMSVVEMHLLAYLACLLSLYRGRPISDWGYSFAITEEGFPFSADLEAAREAAVALGNAAEVIPGLIEPIHDRLREELEAVLGFSPFAYRLELLKVASQCAVTLPSGSVRDAISRSPGVAQPFRNRQRGPLLQTADIELLHEEYFAVKGVLGGDPRDLLSPATLWLSARVLRNEEMEVA